MCESQHRLECQVVPDPQEWFPQIQPAKFISLTLIDKKKSMRLTRSLDGFVSSKRIINRPLYIFAKYLLRVAALACPICK